MSANTKIEWAHHTFNPWYGCQKVSTGCDHCYAEGWAKRSGLVQWGPGAGRRRSSPRNWRQPLKWNADAGRLGVRHRVFCASLADVFDNQVPEEWRSDVFALIEATPHLDWLLVTKRIGNAKKMMFQARGGALPLLHNVWLGITVVNQEEADRDIPKLLEVPSVIRFLSMEPLLGPVDFYQTSAAMLSSGHPWRNGPILGGINWVIAGGESGPNARPSHPNWFRSLRDQCAEAEVPFFFKQWGEWGEAWGGCTHLIYPDGRVVEGSHEHPDAWKHKTAETIARMGKQSSGRLIDGVIHDAFPAPEVESHP